MTAVLDLFAGPGGWDVAAHALGLRPLGVELDGAACLTRAAAGLHTLQADVAALDPQETLRALNDVRYHACEEDGVEYPGDLHVGDLAGLIASPPCQAFSMAGQGAGRRAMRAYEEAIEAMWERGVRALDREVLDEACDDPRGHLVLEPLRWAIELKPRWLALEQVEPVLPLWEAMATVLRRSGYSTWCGVLSAERYGVPQTRRRAILLARRDGVEAREPPATHRRYIAPRRRAAQEESLFDALEPERIVEASESNLLPWVSMAEALGWSDDEVGFPRRNDVEGDDADYRERDLRPTTEPAFALTEKARSWTRFRANGRANATERDLEEPAPTITGGHDHAERTWITGQRRSSGPGAEREPRSVDEPSYTLRANAGGGSDGVGRSGGVEWVVQTNNFTAVARDEDGERSKAGSVPYARPISDPAPTVDTRAGAWSVREGQGVHGVPPERIAACGCDLDFVDADGFCACCHAHLEDPDGLYAMQGDGTHSIRACPAFVAPASYNSRDQRDTRTGVPVHARRRSVDEPAPTIAGESRNDSWVERRPATTVNGDPRISEPGHHDSDVSGSQQANAVRVSVAEAAVLQSFPPDYPWQGTRTKVFEQIGNAVPPLLALAVLREVLA